MADNKIFTILTNVKGAPGASDSSAMTLTIPAGREPGAGRNLNHRILVSRGAAAATLAQIRSGMRELQFVLGTETVQKLKVSELLATYEANGYTNEAGIVDKFFAEPWRATVTDEEVLAPDTRNYDNAALVIDVTNDATPLAFEFDQEYDLRVKEAADKTPIKGMIGKTVQIENIGGGVADFLLNTLNGPLQRAYLFYPSTATVSRVKISQGDTTIYNRQQTTTRLGLKAQLKGMGMVIPANFTDYAGTWSCWPVIFDNNQQLRNAIMNPVGLKIEITVDTACTVRLLRETQIAR